MAPNPSATSMRAVRYLGALSLIAVGVVHLQQYFGADYRAIHIIGPLFVANFVIGLALGLALLAPIERIGTWAAALAALGGMGFAAGTIIGLEISEYSTLFGFHEHGYRLAIVLSIVFEGAAIVLLGAYLLGLRRGRRAPRYAGQTPRPAVPAQDQQVTHANRPGNGTLQSRAWRRWARIWCCSGSARMGRSAWRPSCGSACPARS